MISCNLEKYRNQSVCVALSGGRDSVALLHYLKERREEYGIALSALTCEHGIRKETSLRDCAFVQELCKTWQIPLTVYRADVPARAKQSHRGLEEEGRKFRYECFARQLQTGVDYVATAHHCNDDAETVLFRLARGTSLFGMAAITERDGIIRPFLGVTRAQIDEYILHHNFPYVEDESNSNQNFARNKIRAQVLPALEEIASGATERIAQFALRAKTDDDYLQRLAKDALMLDGDEVKIPVDLPLPVLTRALVLAMKTLGVTRDYTQANVEELYSLTRLQSGKRASLPCGIEGVREGAQIVLYRLKTLETMVQPFTLGKTVYGEFTLVLEQTTGKQAFQTCKAREMQKEGALVFDFDALPVDCEVRTRREGDRFQPFGGREKSLKKYLTDCKIPARVSKTLPIIAKGREIYAVCGVEISQKIAICEKTKRFARLIISQG